MNQLRLELLIIHEQIDQIMSRITKNGNFYSHFIPVPFPTFVFVVLVVLVL